MNRNISNRRLIIVDKPDLIWCKYKEGSLPPEDVDVLAYSKKWIDADNNPKGVRIGFRVEDRFYSAQWDGDACIGYIKIYSH